MTDRTAEDDLAQLATEGRRLGDVAAVDLALPVPSCPGWTQADLLRHVGRIYRWAHRNVSAAADERQSLGELEMPSDDEVVEWFHAGLEQLVALLEDTSPDTELWTYGTDGTARFWFRRMAHESLVHRWDAQAARNDEEAIDADAAVDAIDDFLDVHILHPGTLAEAESVLHVRAEDANADWSLDPEFADELGRGFAEGDAHLSGPASDLLLTLWRRIDPDSVRWEGDRAAVRAWSDVLAELDL